MNRKILLVDDDTNLLNGYNRNLRKQFDVNIADSGEKALKLLEAEESFAVIMADQRMPGMDGVTLLRHANNLYQDTVRIMLSGYADVDTALAAVNEGQIFRFLVKPYPMEDLKIILEHGVQEYNRREQVRMAGITDPLTNLYNRRFIDLEFSRCIMRTRREGGSFGIIFCDINGFKKINDSFGHALGDQVICTIGNVIKEAARFTDIVGRFGGDEFIVLIPSCDEEQLKILEQRLSERVQAMQIQDIPHARFSISIGGAIYPRDGVSWDELLMVADTRMYQQKHRL
jgi:two-component system cell cycle response regulator